MRLREFTRYNYSYGLKSLRIHKVMAHFTENLQADLAYDRHKLWLDRLPFFSNIPDNQFYKRLSLVMVGPNRVPARPTPQAPPDVLARLS